MSRQLQMQRDKVKQVLVCALILTVVTCVFPSIDKPAITIPGMRYLGFPFYFVSFFMIVPAGVFVRSLVTDFILWAVVGYFLLKYLLLS